MPSFQFEKLIKSSSYLTIDNVKMYVYHILCGLKYIHSCDVLHRDLKTRKYFIEPQFSN